MSKILIVGPAWVGDMVMAQSLFKVLKQEQPAAEIHVLAPSWTLPLLNRMQEVSHSILIDIPHGKLALSQRFKIGKELRRQQYQQAIILPNSFKSALIPFFAKIPIRTGWRGECRYFILNDLKTLDKKKYPKMIDRFTALTTAKQYNLFPELVTDPHTVKKAIERHSITVETKPILALCPGSEFGPAKRWPEKYFAEVAREKLKEGWHVWLFGSANDKPLADEIMRLTTNQCLNLIGKTRLDEAIDLLSLVTGVVTNDSGLMHVAAALKKPLIALYGSTSAEFTPPLCKKAIPLSLNLNCQPCFKRVCPLKHHHCMQELLPEKVLQLISRVF